MASMGHTHQRPSETQGKWPLFVLANWRSCLAAERVAFRRAIGDGATVEKTTTAPRAAAEIRATF